MPKLSPPRDGAQSRSASPSRRHFSSSVTRPAISTPSVSSSSGSTSSSVAPATVRRASTPAPRSASKARSRTGRPLRPSARPTKRICELLVGRERAGPGGAQVDAVRDDPVAAAVVAAGGPLGRLGDGDAGVQLGVDAACADHVGRDRVGQPARRVGVEGGDRRRARRLDREPADHRRVRLVHVDDVIAAVRAAPGRASNRLGEDDRLETAPFIGQAEGAPERDQVVGHGPPVRGGRRGEVHAPGDRRGRTGRGGEPRVPGPISSCARASTWRPTPPGYVYE